MVHVAALSTGVIGCELEGDAIIFCRTSRIFSCKQILVGNTSECLACHDIKEEQIHFRFGKKVTFQKVSPER